MLRWLVRTLLAILIPIVLVIGGGALVGVGINYSLPVVMWIGIALLAAGIIWGLVLFLSEGSLLDD